MIYLKTKNNLKFYKKQLNIKNLFSNLEKLNIWIDDFKQVCKDLPAD